ncbi:hypothetical protein CDAR_486761 [Caerostris darwini]|uniref:Uncharacterized protein n=1 Tax=Caerostris darwini TaxID=1538125 RepID=A0AAV4P134_9ARAC|nr:hypothetical protein CDAR_486761 [Caerostris darwini]
MSADTICFGCRRLPGKRRAFADIGEELRDQAPPPPISDLLAGNIANKRLSVTASKGIFSKKSRSLSDEIWGVWKRCLGYGISSPRTLESRASWKWRFTVFCDGFL